MENFQYLLHNFFPLGVILVAVILCALLYILVFRRREGGGLRSDPFEELYRRIHEDITFAVSPKFMELSIGVSELVDLAVEIWRIEQRLIKSASDLPENQRKGLEISVQKLKRYIGKYDIEVIDYTGQKYNEGLNLDVLSVETDPTLTEPMIKETVEPTIMCKGQVVRKAKIVLVKQ